jgi:hypothetical protein
MAQLTSLLESTLYDPLIGMMLATLASVLVVSLVWLLSNPRMDSREPPLVSPRIPLFGHLLGLMTSQVAYFSYV